MGRWKAIFPFECIAPTKRSIKLRCFSHMKDDMKAELEKIGTKKQETRDIIASILGSEFNGTRKLGLVDSSTMEYNSSFAELSATWPRQSPNMSSRQTCVSGL